LRRGVSETDLKRVSGILTVIERQISKVGYKISKNRRIKFEKRGGYENKRGRFQVEDFKNYRRSNR